ncbi:MAG: nicotinate-nucleotide--dimethylbenzimidazole phosphoribosyltransferase [Pseudomonadota bacterium]
MPDPFASLAAFANHLDAPPAVDQAAMAAAAARNDVLTKPPGALGRLEALALWLAGWHGRPVPRLDQVQIAVFAGNHGVTAQGVSAFPAEVTAQMVANFEAGGAAINQLARLHGAALTVHALALETPTADLTQAPAMTEEACLEALRAGWEAVDPAADLLILGEMGIGNTTVAACLGAALFGGAGQDWAGRGTGVDAAGQERKAAVVDAALARHGPALGDPFEALRRLGGREVAAMVGAMARARMRRIPVLLDGFVVTAAAAVLARRSADLLAHCLAGHRSAEQAHGRMLTSLRLDPLLDLDMRLGEGSGAAVALGVLRAAVACHGGMATFADAGVSGKDDAG